MGRQATPELHSFLAEEVFGALDPELRTAAIESSVARVVTPTVASALGPRYKGEAQTKLKGPAGMGAHLEPLA